MATPIKVDGRDLFVTLPSLEDMSTFKQRVATERRRSMYAAIPDGVSDEKRRQWMRDISDECDEIDPFDALVKILDIPNGPALVFYCHLRHATKDITMQWCVDLCERAAKGDEPALLGVIELRSAVEQAWGSKKNEQHRIESTVRNRNGATSRQRTSHSRRGTGSHGRK
jgi:hypothetical protein